jgi:hypothetical protein
MARFAELGFTAVAGSPADFGNPIAAETEKWAKMVKLSGAKAGLSQGGGFGSVSLRAGSR